MPEPRRNPVLVYDGDCGVCTRAVRFAERHLAKDVDIVAFQHADLDSLALTRKECEDAVQWVRPDGLTSRAHFAVGDLLRASAFPWWLLGGLIQIPPFSWVASIVYRLVATNRHRIPGGTPASALPPEERPGARVELRPDHHAD